MCVLRATAPQSCARHWYDPQWGQTRGKTFWAQLEQAQLVVYVHRDENQAKYILISLLLSLKLLTLNKWNERVWRLLMLSSNFCHYYQAGFILHLILHLFSNPVEMFSLSFLCETLWATILQQTVTTIIIMKACTVLFQPTLAVSQEHHAVWKWECGWMSSVSWETIRNKQTSHTKMWNHSWFWGLVSLRG